MTASSQPAGDRANDHLPDVPTDQLISIFAAGPGRLRTALVGLSSSELCAQPIPGKWSIQEIAIHLADSELFGATRIRQAVTGSDRNFAFYHQEIWCNEFAYQQADAASLSAAVDLFACLRATTTDILRKLPADRWERTGYHPEHGEMSVRQLLGDYVLHCERHLSQIVERRRALGKPIDLPQLIVSLLP